MRLKGVIKPLEENESFKRLMSDIEAKKVVEVEGLSDSSRSYLISCLYENNDKSIAIITNSDVEAKNIYEDLNFFCNNVYYFPSKEIVFYNLDAISGDLRWERLKVIKEILSKKKNIVVLSVENLTASLTPKRLFKKHQISLRVSQEVELKKVASLLIESGYTRVGEVEGKGEFALRGGILDVYPVDSLCPYRVELFGDEIESIRSFNTMSQRSIEKVKSINIFPAKEVILEQSIVQDAIDRILAESKQVIDGTKDKEKISRVKRIVNNNIEMLRETGKFETIDSYLPFFYQECESLFDYLEDYLFIVDNETRVLGKIDSTYLEFNENYSVFLERGDILLSQSKLMIDKEVMLSKLSKKTSILLENIGYKHTLINCDDSITLIGSNINNYKGQLDYLLDDILVKKNEMYKILILSGTRARGERFVKTLRDIGIESVYKEKIDNIDDGQVVVTFGNLLHGFDCKETKTYVISDKEVFGEAKRKLTKSKKNKKGVSKINSFSDLKPGDYVVHVNHGIGVYKGIKQIEVGGSKRDYLDIAYDKGDKLYIPVEQLDLVQKYIGSEGKSPKVSKLGGSEWQKAKKKVKASINEIAEDLVKLYATRSAIKGFKFSKDNEWQRQFEDEFPFEETPDQLSSIEEIKKDMESSKVMDRLLCGDVGYGKTEVAIRAAFKAVLDGKQVAFLVPTTILAEQHYKNLKKRFSDFAVTVDMISRFRTAKEQKETLKKTKEGNVDILIGTHRLVSKDIEFKDLGLLIVDEEQRFGVAQKEKIQKLKNNVDVLTLSATPIPRTLHMSLSGVRDISVIETPPEERYPIQTYVVEQNDQLIRDAILREINRDGQVYFVYNRVENIEKMAAYIESLVPESKVAIAHGQMTERQLEKVMLEFMNKEYNVLVCTTIIETGIDIQNVNTIIINDSDKMGLSQLYQLRGRVGRSNRIAYAYLLYKRDKVLSEIAEKRLKALRDFTELGSGFKIAMRDLEIRGAGNIMGSSQHGHMATVGYDLYCRMLEDAVKLIKGEIEDETVDTTIELRVDAYIPSQYIEDELQKIEIYKKIAVIEDNEDYEEVREELLDRYSDIPQTVLNLMDIAYIKNKAKSIFIEEIKEEGNYVIFKFALNSKGRIDIMKKLMLNYKEFVVIRFGDSSCFYIKHNGINKIECLQFLKEIIDFISKKQKN